MNFEMLICADITHLVDLFKNVAIRVSVSHKMEYDIVTGLQHVHLNRCCSGLSLLTVVVALVV
jgi:hypothetical protein